MLPLHEGLVGRATLRYLRQLEASQSWSLSELRELQQIKLRRLLQHAFAMCPFYRDRILASGVQPARVRLEDLALLPTLSKADVAANFETIINSSVRHRLRDCTTGGSTGTPLAFKVDRSRQAADQAARARSRRWFGVDLGQREILLWGSPIEFQTRDRIKMLRDRLTNQLLLNAFRMTPSRMSRYLDCIERFDPVHIFAYPSSITRLVRHGIATGRPLTTPSLKAVFVTGELLDPMDRATIEAHFGVPVADGYGSREAGFIAHQCPAGGYHVTMESVIVEIIGPNGTPADVEQSGEIVITHLDAMGMPFIRYRTGDVGRRRPGICECGRELEMLEIVEGRQTDMLRTADGGYAHALSVIYVLRDEPGISQFKVTQYANLDLDVSIVARNKLDESANARIARLLQKQMRGPVSVTIRHVAQIPPDASGKHRHVVSVAV